MAVASQHTSVKHQVLLQSRAHCVPVTLWSPTLIRRPAVLSISKARLRALGPVKIRTTRIGGGVRAVRTAGETTSANARLSADGDVWSLESAREYSDDFLSLCETQIQLLRELTGSQTRLTVYIRTASERGAAPLQLTRVAIDPDERSVEEDVLLIGGAGGSILPTETSERAEAFLVAQEVVELPDCPTWVVPLKRGPRLVGLLVVESLLPDEMSTDELSTDEVSMDKIGMDELAMDEASTDEAWGHPLHVDASANLSMEAASGGCADEVVVAAAGSGPSSSFRPRDDAGGAASLATVDVPASGAPFPQTSSSSASAAGGSSGVAGGSSGSGGPVTEARKGARKGQRKKRAASTSEKVRRWDGDGRQWRDADPFPGDSDDDSGRVDALLRSGATGGGGTGGSDDVVDRGGADGRLEDDLCREDDGDAGMGSNEGEGEGEGEDGFLDPDLHLRALPAVGSPPSSLSPSSLSSSFPSSSLLSPSPSAPSLSSSSSLQALGGERVVAGNGDEGGDLRRPVRKSQPQQLQHWQQGRPILQQHQEEQAQGQHVYDRKPLPGRQQQEEQQPHPQQQQHRLQQPEVAGGARTDASSEAVTEAPIILAAETPADGGGVKGGSEGRRDDVAAGSNGSRNAGGGQVGGGGQENNTRRRGMMRFRPAVLAVARSIALACVLDQRSSVFFKSSMQKSLLVGSVLEKTRGPLQAIRTLGSMLMKHLERGQVSRDLASGIMVQEERVANVFAQLEGSLPTPGYSAGLPFGLPRAALEDRTTLASPWWQEDSSSYVLRRTDASGSPVGQYPVGPISAEPTPYSAALSPASPYPANLYPAAKYPTGARPSQQMLLPAPAEPGRGRVGGPPTTRLLPAAHTLAMGACDLLQLLAPLAAASRALAAQQRIEFSLSAPPQDRPLPFVLADPVSLRSALSNVVDFALRHTVPGGAVQVDARPVVLLAVSDAPPVVPPSVTDIDAIFAAESASEPTALRGQPYTVDASRSFSPPLGAGDVAGPAQGHVGGGAGRRDGDGHARGDGDGHGHGHGQIDAEGRGHGHSSPLGPGHGHEPGHEPGHEHGQEHGLGHGHGQGDGSPLGGGARQGVSIVVRCSSSSSKEAASFVWSGDTYADFADDYVVDDESLDSSSASFVLEVGDGTDEGGHSTGVWRIQDAGLSLAHDAIIRMGGSMRFRSVHDASGLPSGMLFSIWLEATQPLESTAGQGAAAGVGGSASAGAGAPTTVSAKNLSGLNGVGEKVTLPGSSGVLQEGVAQSQDVGVDVDVDMQTNGGTCAARWEGDDGHTEGQRDALASASTASGEGRALLAQADVLENSRDGAVAVHVTDREVLASSEGDFAGGNNVDVRLRKPVRKV